MRPIGRLFKLLDRSLPADPIEDPQPLCPKALGRHFACTLDDPSLVMDRLAAQQCVPVWR